MKYLLDTCVISELIAKQPNEKVIRWIDRLEDERVFLSVITIGEIRKGIEKLPNSKRKTTLQDWLNYELLVRFNGRILAIDTEVILQWGQLIGKLELDGKKMAAMDSLIAAIGLHYNLHLVTRNEEDFRYATVMIINPWQDV
ncbi:VapC toxin family PIN domain ribonuclease [filamentous cyanobacterium CCP2]|nr:VapC toxin family PIN domain ribonuclease [filamentous cyanobacterium CCP2]